MTRSLAARIYDQDTLSEREIAFLDAMSRADRAWIDALDGANLAWGGGSDAWHIVKRLATRQRNAAYARAKAALEADDDEQSQQAAE